MLTASQCVLPECKKDEENGHLDHWMPRTLFALLLWAFLLVRIFIMHVLSLCVVLCRLCLFLFLFFFLFFLLFLFLLLFILLLLFPLFVFFLLAFLLSMICRLFVLLSLFRSLNPEQLLGVPLVTNFVSMAGMERRRDNLPFEISHY